MRVIAEFFNSFEEFAQNPDNPAAKYELDHSDPQQRKTLGQRCKDAFAEKMVVVTYPKLRG